MVSSSGAMSSGTLATESVQEGRSVLEEASPDLLIADVRLGAFNGLQLIAMSPRPIPTIVTTGFPDPVLETEARQFGAKFLLKPIEPAGLLTLVAELLRAESVKLTALNFRLSASAIFMLAIGRLRCLS